MNSLNNKANVSNLGQKKKPIQSNAELPGITTGEQQNISYYQNKIQINKTSLGQVQQANRKQYAIVNLTGEQQLKTFEQGS